MCKIIGILLVLVAGKVHGICIHDARTLAKADIIISVIPMKGELLLETVPSPESEFRSYRIRSMRCAGRELDPGGTNQGSRQTGSLQ